MSSPSPTVMSIPSPASEQTSPSSGPSRKRPRTEVSSEERKEARAHRNRIAAQNSRDRRKAQFSYMERKLADLEEENRQLRAAIGNNTGAVATTTLANEKSDKDRENEELRERIKTLERGWDAVVKALASQGLVPPMGPTSSSADAAQPLTLSQPQPTSLPQPQAQSPTHPTFSASTTTNSPMPTFPISPAPSHSSLDFELSVSPDSHIFSSEPVPDFAEDRESTRHLAAGGLADPIDIFSAFPLAVPSQQSSPLIIDLPPPEQDPGMDDASMEILLREILASPSSLGQATGLPPAEEELRGTEMLFGDETPEMATMTDDSSMNGEWDIQRLLSMLPSSSLGCADSPSMWNPNSILGVGVF